MPTVGWKHSSCETTAANIFIAQNIPWCTLQIGVPIVLHTEYYATLPIMKALVPIIVQTIMYGVGNAGLQRFSQSIKISSTPAVETGKKAILCQL